MKDNHRADQVRLEANGAVQAQLATLPRLDQARAERALTRLVENPNSSSPVKKRLIQDRNLWSVRISPQLRALVRIDHDKVTLIAIARHDELGRYWLDN
jgi:mRNA-degrading endonuclease RelE of RelBE toxin-antitoxin system